MAVRDPCCLFPREKLDPANCWGILSFADTHSIEGFLHTCDELIVNHFADVLLSGGFLQLPYKTVDYLLSSSTPHHYKGDAWNAIMKWINYDLESREIFLCETVPRLSLCKAIEAGIRSSFFGEKELAPINSFRWLWGKHWNDLKLIEKNQVIGRQQWIDQLERWSVNILWTRVKLILMGSKPIIFHIHQ